MSIDRIESWILDETELAEHYKEIGKESFYKSKMELVDLLIQQTMLNILLM